MRRRLGPWLTAVVLGSVSCATSKPSHEAARNAELCEQDFQAALGPNAVAEVECGWAVQLDPKNAKAWATRGILFLRRGEQASAKESFQAALRLEPNLPRAVLGMGVVSFWEGHFADSAHYFERVSRGEPTNAAARYNWALAQYFAKDGAQASRVLLDLTAKWPKLAYPWHLLAVIRLDDDYPHQALRLSWRALKVDPTVAAEWAVLGLAYERLSRRDDAEYAFRSCLDISPKDGDCRKNLELMAQGEPLVPPKVAPLRY